MTKAIRFGFQTPPQNVTWDQMIEAWELIDQLGFDTAWTFDHFFPILSDPSGPCFEGWTALTALAVRTSRVKVGVLVSGNTYRHPAVLANMGATLDHVTGGRLLMGMGAAWFDMEHDAYGLPYYSTAERISRLDEAVQVVKLLWSEKRASFKGKHYTLDRAYCEPKPLQKPRPPILIGAGGEKLALRVVARHADIWNTFGSPLLFKHKLTVLKHHCDAVGRDVSEIEVSWAGTTLVTDSKTEKQAVIERAADAFRVPPEQLEPGMMVGPLEEIRERIARFIEVGVTHFIFILNAPYDLNTIRKLGELLGARASRPHAKQ